MSESLPADVAALIDTSLGSVTQLEVLLAIAGSEGGATTDALTGSLRISVEHVEQALASLRRAGLVTPQGEGWWRYARPSPEIDDCVVWLLENHRTYRVAITTRIFSRPDDKLTGLADGFRFRRPKRPRDG